MVIHPQGGDDALARAVAAVIAANGRVDEREPSTLTELGAFERMGATAERFVQMPCDCICDMGVGLQRRRWLDGNDVDYIDERLAAIPDLQLRLLLRRWGLSHVDVSQGMQADRA